MNTDSRCVVIGMACEVCKTPYFGKLYALSIRFRLAVPVGVRTTQVRPERPLVGELSQSNPNEMSESWKLNFQQKYQHVFSRIGRRAKIGRVKRKTGFSAHSR